MNDFKNTLSFCELRNKEVVNVLDGRRLGRIVDIIFSEGHKATVQGIVVPFAKKFFFFREKDVFVPWQCIKKIGEDVILVELIIDDGHHQGGGGKRKKRGRYDGVRVHGANGSDREGNENEDGSSDDTQSMSDTIGRNDDLIAKFSSPKFDINKKSAEKKKPIMLKNQSKCDHKCEKCMLFDCTRRWKTATV